MSIAIDKTKIVDDLAVVSQIVSLVPVTLLPKNVQLALAVAGIAAAAVRGAINTGDDVTDAQLEAMFDQDAALVQIDAQARQQRLQLGQGPA